MRCPLAFLLGPALVALAATSCGPSKDPIVAVVDGIVEAAGDRDAAGIAEHLAGDLDADGQGRAEIAGLLREGHRRRHCRPFGPRPRRGGAFPGRRQG